VALWRLFPPLCHFEEVADRRGNLIPVCHSERSEESGWGRLVWLICPLALPFRTHVRNLCVNISSVFVVSRLPRRNFVAPRSDRVERCNLSFRGGRRPTWESHSLPVILNGTQWSEESVCDYFHCLIYPNQILHFVQNDSAMEILHQRDSHVATTLLLRMT